MIEFILTFLLILSILFVMKHLVLFIIRVTEESPTPIKIDLINQIFLYLSISYIITILIT